MKDRPRAGSHWRLAGSSIAVAALLCGLLATSPASAQGNCDSKNHRYLVTFTHGDTRSIVDHSSDGVQTVTGTLTRSFVFGITLESRKCKSGLKSILVKGIGPGQNSTRISGSDPRTSGGDWAACNFDFTATIPEHELSITGIIQPTKKRWDFSLLTHEEDPIYQAEVEAKFQDQCPGVNRGTSSFFSEDVVGKSVGDLYFDVPSAFYNYVAFQVSRSDETSANKPPDEIKALYKGQSTTLAAAWSAFAPSSETTFSIDLRIGFQAV
jgi:hypothetical protein